MSYIGSTPTNQSFIAGTDSFNGTGSATNFTLSRSVNSTNDIQVVVNNVVQYPPNYSVSGNTLTISPAPSAGTNNVYVRYLSTTLQSIAPSQGIAIQFGTGSASLPSISFIGDSNTGIYSPAADTIAFAEGGTEVARFDSSGNLLVGTTTASILSASGRGVIEVNGSGDSAIGFKVNNTLYGYLFNSSVEFRIANFTANPVTFFTNNTEQARITSAGLFQFNSGYGSVATAFGCRAWVNFNGTGTVAIRASGNVTSITDNGVGNYTVNFTNAMPDANYAASGNASGATVVISGTRAAGSWNTQTATSTTSALVDPVDVLIAIFR